MPKFSRVAGATSQSVSIFIQDSSSTTGAGLTGLAYNTSSLVAYYTFTGANATATAITLATLAAVNSAYSSGGFKEIDATNMPGLYRLDIPNAALAASSGNLSTIMLKGATNMAPCLLEIELTAWNNQDSVRGGMTAMPNAAAGASGGLLISGSNSGTTTLGALTVTGAMTLSDGLAVSRSSSNTSAITATGNGTGHGAVFTSGSGATGNGVNMTAASTNGSGLTLTATGTGLDLNGKTTNSLQVDVRQFLGTASKGTAGYAGIDWSQINAPTTTVDLSGTTIKNLDTVPPTAAAIATAVWQDSTAGDFTTASSIGKSLYTSGVVPGGSGGLFIAGSNAATTVNITGNITGNLSGSVGSVTGAVGSVTGAVGSVTGDVGGKVVGSVASVVGNVGGNVVGSVGSVTAGVTVTTNNDKTGYSLTQSFPSNFASMAITAAGLVSPTSNVKKNTASAGFSFVMTDATTHTPQTGLTVTGERSLDGAAFGALANAITEVAEGWYTIDLAAADVNGDHVALRFTATGADDCNIAFVTDP